MLLHLGFAKASEALPYYVVMRHITWGNVDSETFYDRAAADSKFAQYNGGGYATIQVDGKFQELAYYGNRGGIRLSHPSSLHQKPEVGP